MLVAGLAAQGFTVDARQNAEAGLAALIEVEYDVVLADLNLPGMSGLEFCAKLAAERPELATLLRLGVREVLVLPIRIDDLARKVRRLFDRAGREQRS